MLTLGGTVLILKVRYELKMRWKTCFPDSDSNRKRHSSQGREAGATRPASASPFRILQHVPRWKKRKKIQSNKQDVLTNNTVWALAAACLASSQASVYDSLLLRLPAIQMLMVLAAEQWKKIPGVVTGWASIWSGEPSLGSSFQQDGRLLRGEAALPVYVLARIARDKLK